VNDMGTFTVGCRVENHKDPKRFTVVPKLPVEADAVFTWMPAKTLDRIGIKRVKKNLQIQNMDGRFVTRDVGFAILQVEKYRTTDEVVFAQRNDLRMLGARALTGMNVRVDASRRRLVDAGPVVAATALHRSSADVPGNNH